MHTPTGELRSQAKNKVILIYIAGLYRSSSKSSRTWHCCNCICFHHRCQLSTASLPIFIFKMFGKDCKKHQLEDIAKTLEKN